MESEESTKEWASKHFGIPKEDVMWYNSGSCYDRIGVLTEASAKKVGEKVKGQGVNGGYLHGMPLGGYTKKTSYDGIEYFDVYC